MIDGSAVLTVFLVYLAGVVIPGPNFVAVVHKAVAATRSEALALVAGIVLVNLFWSTCALAGLSLVFAAFPWAALVVKVLGAAYLIGFGLRLLINAGKTTPGPLTAASAVIAGSRFFRGW
nr:LysE family transporter [Pseudomonas morbosilactucae]